MGKASSFPVFLESNRLPGCFEENKGSEVILNHPQFELAFDFFPARNYRVEEFVKLQAVVRVLQVAENHRPIDNPSFHS